MLKVVSKLVIERETNIIFIHLLTAQRDLSINEAFYELYFVLNVTYVCVFYNHFGGCAENVPNSWHLLFITHV